MTRGDMHYLKQRDCLSYEKLWKIYWWGGRQDELLIKSLERFPRLTSLPSAIPERRVIPGRGFQRGNQENPAGWLGSYQALLTRAFKRYGTLTKSAFGPVPEFVERRGVEDVFHGRRLLIGRGIKTGGFINARFETQKYAFRNSIHGVKLQGFEPWHEAILIGIFWSSLARYYYFSGAGSWGPWHDESRVGNFELSSHQQSQRVLTPPSFPSPPPLLHRVSLLAA